ncbi:MULTISPECIES: squalene/phytoene synthase family protein [unclassified Iodidimonas]|jgi:phytoene synthase|uniref:phytoene/squalene synthase family protein n=1 Tax=unclassified Iodidimonas TaxID=2626145 RepID=UPI0024826115|nr:MULTISPECIES: squalene/phytoene synthase family protein [unclassified Iodidimonas]
MNSQNDHSKLPALSPCAQMVRDHDHDRWLTLLYAAPKDREDLAALYAFNHEVAKTREQISEPMLGEIRLQWWRETIDGLYEGRPRRHPVADALALVLERHALDRTAFMALIDARSADLYDEGPQGLGDLIAYADATGGGLNALAAQICGADDPADQEAAHAIGRAWALTGIVRALGFQAAMQNTTLPKEALDAAGIAPESLYRGDFAPELKPFIRELAAQAAKACATARKRQKHFPPKARSPMLLGILTDDYLLRLKRGGDDPFKADFARGAAMRQLKLLIAAWRGRY